MSTISSAYASAPTKKLPYHAHRDITGRCESPVSRHYIRRWRRRSIAQYSAPASRRLQRARCGDDVLMKVIKMSRRHLSCDCANVISHERLIMRPMIESIESDLWCTCLLQICSVLQPSLIRGLATPWTYFLRHSDWLFHGESCPRLDVVHPGRVWSSSPACTWHCSLHYLFLQATPLFPHDVHGVHVCQLPTFDGD